MPLPHESLPYCKRCRVPKSSGRPFVGNHCRECHNALRRERYRNDPQHRMQRKQQALRAADRVKKRLYMRRWRARQRRQREEQEIS